MNAKTLGGILLVVGTSIGGGMLALPITAAASGFISSSLLLVGCWLLMTCCAFLVLEVNLWLPANSNIISMANATLGKIGAGIAWLTYLILFYCLLAAYISSGSDILDNFFSLVGISSPAWLTAILFVGLLGFVVYQGIQLVDYVNRGLMTVKMGAYLLLVVCIIVYLDPQKLLMGQPKFLISAVTVMITSYGFASIVPSLRVYFKDDVSQLRRVILIGSLIPLLCYLLWDLAILGVIPHSGEHSLGDMLTSGHSTTDLVAALNYHSHSGWITILARTFTTVCVATSFLGVTLGLSDFLADGLNIAKRGSGNIIIYTACLLPPLLISLFYPNAFIVGLSYAGLCCILLLVVLPTLMAWRGRYHLKLWDKQQLPGGKFSLLFILLISMVVIAIGIYYDFS